MLLRKLAPLAASVLVACACAGCGAAATVHATRDPHFTTRFQHLYVAIDQGGIDRDFAVGLEKSLWRRRATRACTCPSGACT